MGLRHILVVASVVVLVAGCGGSSVQSTLASDATSFRRQLHHGGLVGRLDVPRIGASALVSAGIDQQTVDQGPGWFERSYLPGEHGLTYIAGHRRTHGAPFRWLGQLRAGDQVVFTLPYATAEYVVIRRARVFETKTSILHGARRDQLRLQASTIPPSRYRLVVFARETAISPNR